MVIRIDMNNKYQEYTPKDFKYDYPWTWFKRNKEYLEKRDDREVLIRDLSQTIHEQDEDNK